jgi:hypothetical protein
MLLSELDAHLGAQAFERHPTSERPYTFRSGHNFSTIDYMFARGFTVEHFSVARYGSISLSSKLPYVFIFILFIQIPVQSRISCCSYLSFPCRFPVQAILRSAPSLAMPCHASLFLLGPVRSHPCPWRGLLEERRS